MRLVKLPQHTYREDADPLPSVFVNPDLVASVVDGRVPGAEDQRPVTALSTGGAFFEIALSVEDTIRALGASVTEVVFRDVTPSDRRPPVADRSWVKHGDD